MSLAEEKILNQKLPSLSREVILAFRPKTLTAAVVPTFAGTALAFSETQKWSWIVLVCALLSAVFIQIGTNLVNDAMDFKKGADDHRRLGPRRITQAGVLSPRQVLILASLAFLVSALLGFPLVWMGGWPIVLVGLLSILMGWAYTSGPWPLAYHGWGDFFVILFFGVVAVMGVYFLHTGKTSLSSFVLGLQIGLLAAVLIAVNNLRDVVTDREVNKKTLAVRWGLQGGRWEIFSLCFLPFVLGVFWFIEGPEKNFLLPLLILPLALRISREIFQNEPGPFYNQILARAAGLHLLFGLVMSLGFLL